MTTIVLVAVALICIPVLVVVAVISRWDAFNTELDHRLKSVRVATERRWHSAPAVDRRVPGRLIMLAFILGQVLAILTAWVIYLLRH